MKKRKIQNFKILIFCCMLLIGLMNSVLIMAQQKSVSGNITDKNGLPLAGVTIVVKGTTHGTVSDANGNYLITGVDSDDLLIFSFVGMETQEIKVGSQTRIDITMQEEAIALEEVVAVGYGIQKKINLTGAVESVNSERINWKPVGQTSMALQGVAPGVTITQNSGQPGKDGGTIRVRGIGTLGTAGQDPLVLIDGIEGKINTVDPNDIENISILKDASSAAIYGSRAANGVILITTKRADNKKISVSYDGYIGWQDPTDMPEIVSGLDHMLLLNEANRNLGQTITFQESYIEEYRKNAPSDLYPDTDWQKLTLTNNGLMQNHSFNVSGGTDFIKLRSSIIHFEQNGLIPNTGYNRNSFRLNTDIQALETLAFKFDIRGSDELQYEPSAGVSNIFFDMNGRIPRNMEGLLSDGRYGQGWLGSNPIAEANDSGKANLRMQTITLNFQGIWTPVGGLDISFMYAPEFYSSFYKEFTHTINTYYGDGRLAYLNPNMSSLTQRSIRTKTDNVRALVNYTKNIKNNNFAVLAGFEQIEYLYESFQGYRENFPLENYQLLSLGSEINQQADGSGNEFALRSYFGRFNYNFKEKYLFEANLRYDGSSRFASGNKYGWFPSFSAGWRISEENFLNSSKTIDNLKLRLSWGELGNQNIGNYPFASSVALTKGYILNEVAVAGASLTELGNTEISWETTEMLNAGLDITFLDKFSATGDFYIKNTRDILLQLPIPMTVGLTEPYQNAGKVRNTGWDLSLTHFNTVNDFKYDVTFALSDVKNEIIDLKGTGPYIGTYTIRMEGQPIDAFYGFKSDGLFQTPDEVAEHATQFGGLVAPGDVKYVDQITVDTDGDGIADTGDGVITAAGDRVVLGSSIPRYTFSLNLNASYKGFDVSMFFQGVGKANGFRHESGVWAFYVGSTAVKRHLDRWTPDNTDASYPRLTFNYPNNEQISDYWMLDAAYLRMKNLQLGYSLPSSLLEKSFIEHCRIYFSAQNLFTIDNFLDGFDVEAPNGSSGFYPMVKTFTFGINLKF
ncbi:MAG: TonB-dependent receptor [Porphyromonadaceae bacterium]|nr:TonB-dependent receptor [Porphyromonadaceae bacterium]